MNAQQPSDMSPADILIVDYGVGNLSSMASMVRRIGPLDVRVSGDPEQILRANRLILPGVGAFDRGMEYLRARDLVQPLTRRVCQEGTPILGVCLGMQLFTLGSEEGSAAGLGWIRATTRRFQPAGPRAAKIPHMGWNRVDLSPRSALQPGLDQDARFYFAHSYYVEPDNHEDVQGFTEYAGVRFASVIQKRNIFGVQFHPEKSHSFGMRLLRNFCET